MKKRSFQQGLREGRRQGSINGYEAGFHAGYHVAGVEAGLSFSGTSIIIPTYNKLEYLKKCIDSIAAHTPEPHEIIVIDNASVDGTDTYLQGNHHRLRYKINQHNYGFAGSINQGLRMARGSHLLLLNNDTVVTPHWLRNLLACVQSDNRVGLAGPVTNYISGEQQIPTSYTNLEQMQQFAEQYNELDSNKWISTQQIIGFCVMMRRDVFERLGFMDEGFEIGNCEDDDYSLRARLLGYELVMARDTFIHHFGSISMKELGTQFEHVYEKNMLYYSQKWQDPHSLSQQVSLHPGQKKSSDFYPSHVLVKTNTSSQYWLENGMRYRVEPELQDWPVATVTPLEMNMWPDGGEIPVQQVSLQLQQLFAIPSVNEGALVQTPDGKTYQLCQGTMRLIISEQAQERWHLSNRSKNHLLEEELRKYPEGLPIIPHPQCDAIYF